MLTLWKFVTAAMENHHRRKLRSKCSKQPLVKCHPWLCCFLQEVLFHILGSVCLPLLAYSSGEPDKNGYSLLNTGKLFLSMDCFKNRFGPFSWIVPAHQSLRLSWQFHCAFLVLLRFSLNGRWQSHFCSVSECGRQCEQFQSCFRILLVILGHSVNTYN